MTTLDHLPHAEGVAVQRMRERIAVAGESGNEAQSPFVVMRETAALDVRLLSVAIELLEAPFYE